MRLRPFERDIFMRRWLDSIEEIRSRIYIRKVRGRCVFQMKNLCLLQPLGLKPLSCKLWPFYVSTVPVSDWEGREITSLFVLDEREYFAYVNVTCKGIQRGSPEEMKQAISEVIALYRYARFDNLSYKGLADFTSGLSPLMS